MEKERPKNIQSEVDSSNQDLDILRDGVVHSSVPVLEEDNQKVDRELEQINHFLTSESEKKLNQLETLVRELSEVKVGLTTELYKSNKAEYLKQLQSLELKMAGMEALLVSYEAQIGIDHPKTSKFQKILLVAVAILKRSMSEASVIRILTANDSKAKPHQQALTRFRMMIQDQKADIANLESDLINQELMTNPEFVKLSKKLIDIKGDISILKGLPEFGVADVVNSIASKYGWKRIDRDALLPLMKGQIQKIDDELALLQRRNST